MKKERFTNATVYYKNSGEQQEISCTNRNLTKTLNKMNKMPWITDIEIVKYDFTEDIEESFVEDVKEDKESIKRDQQPIKAVKVDDRVIFTNIWTDELRCKVSYISCNENFTDLLELNKTYTMEELYKLGEDNNTYDMTLKAIKYLQEVCA